jgi:hypothetical protein
VEASQEHRDKCQVKLNILLEQRTDLSTAIDDLLQILKTDKFMKVYKQMKMYNDDELNPVSVKRKKVKIFEPLFNCQKRSNI